jgi:hypothetical protein
MTQTVAHAIDDGAQRKGQRVQGKRRPHHQPDVDEHEHLAKEAQHPERGRHGELGISEQPGPRRGRKSSRSQEEADKVKHQRQPAVQQPKLKIRK